ncbi:uncharacterized protein Rv1276c/MT1313 [Arthrobacter sp. Hiyo6]|nr:uncharacterized protein Rv1276c/MT1313 [Arthrobacter sp. Hiyo6]
MSGHHKSEHHDGQHHKSEHHKRRLILMRHSKADWPGGVADHERPLEERGHLEAPLAGKWLLKHGVVPDFILCSSALRTRQTCTWVCSALGDKAPTPKLEDGLYGASALRMLTVINHVPDTVTTLMVISHMPACRILPCIWRRGIPTTTPTWTWPPGSPPVG